MRPLIHLIGAGKLGKTIGHLFFKHQVADIGAVLNSSLESSEEAIRFIGAGLHYESISHLPAADIILIGTPDEYIPLINEQLSQTPHLKPSSLVLHCSGVLSSDVLAAVKKRGCYTASVHPMRSFAKPSQSIEEYSGTYCAVEGDDEILPWVYALFKAIGSIVYPIDKSKKALYHAAGVFASNYLVTLCEQALICMKQALVAEEIATEAILHLMQGSLSNLKKTLSPRDSLTGPIQRADVSSIEMHLKAMSEPQRSLYSILGQATLDLSQWDAEKKQDLMDALQRMGLET